MIEIKEKRNCSGCTSCYSICPVSAIIMVEDEEGFYYPKIDKKKCINCGACDKTCQYVEEYINNESVEKPQVYGGWSKEKIYREIGTSGGVFSNIAKYVIERNGVVCGAAFDENLEVKHIIVDNISDLQKINGSKYVQSNMEDTFMKIKKKLDENVLVLFSGTPCQVTGVQKYLQKRYPNFITVDVVCHGVPSPKVYRKYKEFLEKKNKARLNKVAFRTKITGWKKYSTYTKYQNGKEEVMYAAENPYMRGFLKDIYLRPSCYNCISSKLPRSSDITLGDFWGVGKNYSELDDDGGTSLIILNTEKGKIILNNIKNELNLKECEIEYAIENNPALITSAKENSSRQDFFKELDDKSFDYLSRKYFPKLSFSYRLKNKIILIIKGIAKK